MHLHVNAWPLLICNNNSVERARIVKRFSLGGKDIRLPFRGGDANFFCWYAKERNAISVKKEKQRKLGMLVFEKRWFLLCWFKLWQKIMILL